MNEIRNVLIVEDNAISAEYIASIVTGIDNYVATTATNIEDAIRVLNSEEIDVVCIDVDLSQAMDGVHLAAIIKTGYKIPFIYITSYSDQESLSRMIGTQPFDILIKPVTEMNLVKTMNKLYRHEKLEVIGTKKEVNQIKNRDSKQELFVKNNGKLSRVAIDEICYVRSEGRYTFIYESGKRLISNQSLKQLETVLTKESFARVHRSYIINHHKIVELSAQSAILKSKTNNQIEIPIGRKYRHQLMDLIQANSKDNVNS